MGDVVVAVDAVVEVSDVVVVIIEISEIASVVFIFELVLAIVAVVVVGIELGCFDVVKTEGTTTSEISIKRIQLLKETTYKCMLEKLSKAFVLLLAPCLHSILIHTLFHLLSNRTTDLSFNNIHKRQI